MTHNGMDKAKLTGDAYRGLKRLIADTFPDIHWEVYSWHQYTGSPDAWEEGKTFLIYGGFVDGWKYGLPQFKAPDGDEIAVIEALQDHVETWWRAQNPGIPMRLFNAVRAALGLTALSQLDGGK